LVLGPFSIPTGSVSSLESSLKVKKQNTAKSNVTIEDKMMISILFSFGIDVI
jgi:hypothetical protein